MKSSTQPDNKKTPANQSHAGWIPKYSKNGLKDLLACVTTHYELKVEVKNQSYRYKTTISQQLPDLGECACEDHAFDRSKNLRRQNAAKRIIDNTLERFPDATSLNYLSIGSGLLMQDFIICAMLLLEGYSLYVRLVEPCCSQEEFVRAYKQLSYLQKFAKEMGLDFEAKYFPCILDYIKAHPKERIHVSQAIDFDAYTQEEKNGKQDLLLAHQALAPKGFLYYAAGNADLFFSKNSVFTFNSRSLAHSHLAKEFLTTSEKVATSEAVLSKTMAIAHSHINKNILSFVGVMNLPDSKKTEPTSTSNNGSSFLIAVSSLSF